MEQTFELRSIIKYVMKDVQRVYLTLDGTFETTNIQKVETIMRMDGSAEDLWGYAHYYALFSEDTILQQTNQSETPCIYEYDGETFTSKITTKQAKTNKQFMDKLNRYSRRLDMVKKLGGNNNLNLSDDMFAMKNVKLKVKQGDKEYYCQYFDKFAQIQYNIYIFRYDENGKVTLEPVDYNRYFYRYHEHQGAGNMSGWLAIPEGFGVAIELASDFLKPSEKNNIVVFDKDGQELKTYKTKEKLMQNIHKHSDLVCTSEVDEWVDFNNHVQVFIETK